MDIELRDHFISLWQNYFPGTGLPVTFEFRKDNGTVQNAPVPDGWRCIICQIGRVRKGASLALDAESITCRGGLLYSGYLMATPPDFRYFLSYGKTRWRREGTVQTDSGTGCYMAEEHRIPSL